MPQKDRPIARAASTCPAETALIPVRTVSQAKAAPTVMIAAMTDQNCPRFTPTYGNP